MSATENINGTLVIWGASPTAIAASTSTSIMKSSSLYEKIISFCKEKAKENGVSKIFIATPDFQEEIQA